MTHLPRTGFTRFMTILFFLVFSLAAVGAAKAQESTASPSPTPSEEERRLLEEKRLIELQRDIELAKKAIRDAQPQPTATPTPTPASTPPAPSSTPLSGEATLENVRLESEMVAYKALSEAAARISGEIKDKAVRNVADEADDQKIIVTSAKNIAIYDAQVVKDWRFYRALRPAFEGHIIDIKGQYKALLCQDARIRADVSALFIKTHCTPHGPGRSAMLAVAGVQTAFAAGTNLVKSFVDLAALFRSDTKIQGLAFTVDESAFVAELFRALKNDYGKNEINLYYPEVFPPRLDESSNTVTLIGDLYLYKTEADEVIKRKNTQKEELEKKLKEFNAKKGKLEEELGPLKKMHERLTLLQANLNQVKDSEVRRKIRSEMRLIRVKLAELLKPDTTFNQTLDEALAEKVKKLEADIKALQENEIAGRETQVKEINEDVKKMTVLNDRFLAFVAEFVKVDSNGINSLALFIRAEDIDRIMGGDDSYWLEIKSVTAGGNNRVRKNLIRYITGPKIDHSGGVVVEYTLYRKSGAVVYSDKLSVYEGYVEPKRIRGARGEEKAKAAFEDSVK